MCRREPAVAPRRGSTPMSTSESGFVTPALTPAARAAISSARLPNTYRATSAYSSHCAVSFFGTSILASSSLMAALSRVATVRGQPAG